MDKAYNPFGEIDFTKFMAELKVPGLNVEQVADSYRKNVEALTAASQAAVEGMQAVVRRQTEIMRESMEEYAALLRSYGTPTTPEQAASKQAELAKHTFENTFAHMKEIGELIAKANSDSLDVINRRVSEMLEEVKTLTAKKKGKAA
ncbi:MAG TPA: phasin family protein [Alphaproteobacteria bacterium]|nr:phasin family protein [Alphaproteobacteria bacterium]